MTPDNPTDVQEAPAGDECRIYRLLTATRTCPEFQDKVRLILKGLQLDDFTHIVLGREGERRSQPVRTITSFPTALWENYDGHLYHHWDATLDYAWHNQRPVFYSELSAALLRFPYESEIKQKNDRIAALYRRHGYYEFYLIPHGAGGRRSLFMVSDRRLDPDRIRRRVAAAEGGQIEVE